jgi:tRNA A-37 threonylcarbamoyl transferase component Bud32/TolB-like protein/tetratricopeptide (TPR) repeat protein
LSDPVRDRISTALSGTHTVERELGGGGMARVFVATERALGRQVVIKTLPDDSWTASSAQRFRREILTAAQLQHANIVPVLTAGDAEGMPYFTMPLVDGATLRERIARGPIPLGEAVGILRDVARALSAAHARGVVHRDIKPENILLSSGAALVTDFGVAKALSVATQGPEAAGTMTGIGVSIGTPAYMSPEQIAAEPTLDHRADLYAWGLVAYELLAGQRPFAELSGTALMKAQLGTMPPALQTVAPHVPSGLATLVMRCLAKEASARPQTAAELLAVLDLPSGETRSAASGGLRRSRVLIGGGAVLLALGAWWMFSRGATGADETMIAVAPFRVGGAAAEARYLREGLGDIIVPQIQTLPDASAAGMRVMLDRWRRIAGSVDEDLDDADAGRAALAAGAGRLILGEVVGTRDRLTVSARLVRARDGRELSRARIEGTADSVFSLATRLVTTLLSISEGDSQERLRTVLSARPEAIASYLAGEQLYRRGRYANAGAAFFAAYNADTTFALAALRVELTNGWTLDDGYPGDWIDRAWRHRARLSGGDSLVLISSAGETYPAPMPIRARIRSLEALASRSGSAEVWYAFADYLFHIGHAVDEPRFNARALEAFQRAEAIDSSFAPALEHQAQLHLVLGDSVGARAAHRRQAQVDSTGDFFYMNDFVMTHTLGSAAEITRAIDDLERRVPGSIPFAAGVPAVDFVPLAPIRMAFADSMVARFRRLPNPPPYSEIGARFLREIEWNAGRPSRAQSAPNDEILSLAEEVMAALLVDGDSSTAQRAVATLRTYVAARQPSDPSATLATANFAIAQWALARGDTAEVERRLGRLRGVTTPRDRPWAANTSTLFEALISAQLSGARRAPDLLGRLERIDSLLVDAPALDRRSARGVGNFVLAELWERAGAPERALRAITRRDGQFAYAMYNADRMRRTARLARQLGRRDEEMAALQHFVEMRVFAEPHLQAEVEQARARLAELKAQGSR